MKVKTWKPKSSLQVIKKMGKEFLEKNLLLILK